MATTKKPNEEEVLLEEPVANPSLKINPTENYNKATATPYQAPTWNGGTGVGAQYNDLAQKAINMNYTDWTKGTDYASLTKRYSQQGQKAMDNTLGMVAARTGGLASSYATAAGNQAYNDYMTKLEDAARALYDSQRAQAVENYGIAQGIYDRQYGEYVDDRNFGYQQYRDTVGDAQWADTMYGNQYNTEWSQDFQQSESDRNQGNIDWEHNFQEGQYADSQAENEAADLEETLYYAPDTYPDYASYKAVNPNTQITEAQFNQIKATAAGKYADDNKQWNYATANDEEQKLHDAIYANSALYPTYADYKAAFPDSTMTESTFNLIKSTAEGQYAIDQQGRTDNQEATSRDDAREQIRTQIQANPDAEISEELLAAAGWDANTIDSYRTISREIKEETGSAKLTDEQNKANSTLAALIAEGMTWDEIEAGYSDVLEASNFGADYWQKKVDNTQASLYKEDAINDIHTILQQSPAAILDSDLIEKSGMSDAVIFALRSYYGDIQSKNRSEEQTQADNKLLQLVSSGMSWEEIKGNDKYYSYVRNSTFGDDYWQKMADNTQSALSAEAKADEEDKLYNEIYANPETYDSYEAYTNTFGDTNLSEAEFNQIKNTALGARAIDDRSWNYATASDAQADARDQALIRFSQGDYPETEEDINALAEATGWDAATINAYRSYYEDLAAANADAESATADAQILDLVGAGMTWDQITANYGNLVESSSFGADYWQNKISQYKESKGFTASQLIAQDDLEMRLQSGEEMSRETINRLAEKTGRSPQYWYAYQKVVQGGELTDEEVAVIDNPAEISSWLENILNDSTGTATADEWFMYYTNLEKIDPDLAYNALYEKAQRGEVTREKVESLMPYLTEDDLDALFNKQKK